MDKENYTAEQVDAAKFKLLQAAESIKLFIDSVQRTLIHTLPGQALAPFEVERVHRELQAQHERFKAALESHPGFLKPL